MSEKSNIYTKLKSRSQLWYGSLDESGLVAPEMKKEQRDKYEMTVDRKLPYRGVDIFATGAVSRGSEP